jgi:hypothetical protein
MKLFYSFLFFLMPLAGWSQQQQNQWIRINQLGYLPAGSKVAVWGTKDGAQIKSFELQDASTGRTVFKAAAGTAFGAYGPFRQTYRLNFSAFRGKGNYVLVAGNARSQVFPINDNVYEGTADFCLRYMRQQRSGFNPFLKDSCHNYDGYTMYGPMPDSTHVRPMLPIIC